MRCRCNTQRASWRSICIVGAPPLFSMFRTWGKPNCAAKVPLRRWKRALHALSGARATANFARLMRRVPRCASGLAAAGIATSGGRAVRRGALSHHGGALRFVLPLRGAHKQASQPLFTVFLRTETRRAAVTTQTSAGPAEAAAVTRLQGAPSARRRGRRMAHLAVSAQKHVRRLHLELRRRCAAEQRR